MTFRRANRLILFVAGYTMTFGLLASFGYMEIMNSDDQQAVLNRAEAIRYPGHKAFFSLPRMELTLSSAQGSSHHVRLDISLEIDKGDMQRFQDFQPRVSDQIVSFLGGQNADAIHSPQGIRDLRQHLLQVANEASGPVPVADVVFREIVIR